MKNRDIYWRRYKTQETLYIGQWCLSPLQSKHLGTSHNSPNHHQLPCCIFLNPADNLKSVPFQRYFYFWEKPEIAGCQIWAVEGLSHLGDLMFHQKLCTRFDACTGVLSQWSCQSPIAHSCSLLNHPNSFCRRMLTLSTKSNADSLLDSLILNVTATQYTCSLNGIYDPQWPVQWSCHCSHMCIPVHSPWLPGYIDVKPTVLLILTMAGLFPDLI